MTDNATPDTEVEAVVKAVGSSLGENFRHIRNRVIAGIFVVLPVFITFAVIGWLYNVLYHYALAPIADWLKNVYFSKGTVDAINASMNDKSGYFLDAFFSLLAVISLLAILFVAGMFAQSRLHRVFDWVLLKVPGIKTIYAAVSNVFNSVYDFVCLCSHHSGANIRVHADGAGRKRRCVELGLTRNAAGDCLRWNYCTR